MHAQRLAAVIRARSRMAIGKAWAISSRHGSAIFAMRAISCLEGLFGTASLMDSGVAICLIVNVSDGSHYRALLLCWAYGHFSRVHNDTVGQTAVKCPQPEDPKNGRAFYDSITFGSIARYQCKSDYKLSGPDNRTCQSNRQWSQEEPECRCTSP